MTGTTTNHWRDGASKVAMATMLALGALTAAPAVAQAAAAQEQAQTFSIPAGPLAESLRQYAEVTGLQTIYSADLVANRSAPAVNGRYSPQQALGLILSGSGLRARQSGQTVTLERDPVGSVADDGSRVTSALLVEGAQNGGESVRPARSTGVAQLGGERGGQDDEAVGYRPVVVSVGVGAPTAVEDVPRSISVITQEQFQKQDIETIAEAIQRLPGVSLVEGTNSLLETGAVYSRGFALSKVQVDGGAAQDLGLIGNGILNLDAYERLELVRGPNAVFAGDRSPGGTLNLVRKRPAAFRMLEYTLGAGSFGRLNVGVDFSTPRLEGSSIAFRGVGTYRTQDEFYEGYSRDDLLLYGIADAPLGAAARIEAGVRYNKTDEVRAYYGVPHFLDGPVWDAPRDANFAWPESKRALETSELFSRAYFDLFRDWRLELGVSYQHGEADQRAGDFQPSVLSDGTSFGAQLIFGEFQTESDQVTTDMRLSGTVKTGPLSHALFVGLDRTNQMTTGGGRDQLFLLFDPADAYPRPNWDSTNGFIILDEVRLQNGSTSSAGMTVSDVISWRDRIDLTLAARKYDYGSRSITSSIDTAGVPINIQTNVGDTDSEWKPSYALVIKPSGSLRVFANHSSGYQHSSLPQYTPDGDLLGPSEYLNNEFGVKWGENFWTASLSYYDMERTNSPQAVPNSQGQCGPGANSFCYFANGQDQESTGWDAEITGQIADGLSIVASYNYNDTKVTATNLPLITQTPTTQAALFIDWRPSFLPKLSTQVGLRYRGDVSITGQAQVLDGQGNPIPPFVIAYDYADPAHTIVDLGADYQLTDRLQIRFFAENIFDTDYYSTVSQNLNFVGRPRSFSVALRWHQASANNGPSELIDLAPFGEPADWYGAFDVGYASRDDLDAISPTVAWRHELDNGALLAGRLGYRISDDYRVEAYVGHVKSDIDRIAGTGASAGLCDNSFADIGGQFDCSRVDGSLRSWTFMTNVIRDFGSEDATFRPYIGAGLGVLQSQVTYGGKLRGIGSDDIADYRSPFGPFYSFPSDIRAATADQSTDLAVQFLGGLSWRVTDQAIVEVGYRYLRSSDVRWSVENAPSNRIGQIGTFRSDYAEQALTVGIRWAFGVR